MSVDNTLLTQLNNLNHITDALNHVSDIHQALDLVLVKLVEAMGLQTGWIFLRDETAHTQWQGRGYILAAHCNFPPALALEKPTAWKGGCDCQLLCNKNQLERAYNEVHCSRLANIRGDKKGLSVHASAPLSSGHQVLGILNVAGSNWSHFSEASLALLSNVGSQIGGALERTRLMTMLKQQRIDEQAALLDLSTRLLNQGADLDGLMQQATADVCQLLQADAGALLLPDDDNPTVLCFQAAIGWYTDPVEACHFVPADESSGPGWVMQTQEPLLISDLENMNGVQTTTTVTQDLNQDFRAYPTWRPAWLLAEKFRGQAVVPLLIDTRPIGAMVINMRQPRLLNEDELRLFQLTANQIAIAIEKASLVRVRIRRERLEEELAIGRRIQLSLLPETNPDIPGWEIASYYRPADQVGGDLYDFFELDNRGRRLGMVIADASGKGVPAALFMALSRSIIRTKAFTGRKTWDVLRRANRLIYKDSRSGLFLTAFYATLDTRTGHLIYTNAGHNRPLWLNVASDNLQELATTGLVLGAFDRVHLGEDQINIEPGDFLVLYTDGVTEAMNSHRDLFGEERLNAVIIAKPYQNAQEMLDAILAATQTHIGDTPPSDDVTILIVRRDPDAG